MPCFHPVEAWYGVKGRSGKRKVQFEPSGAIGLPFKVPCGRCTGCRLMRAAEWATRCVHEAKFHAENAFITLTYSAQHLPSDGSLSVRDAQLFMHRLRKHLAPKRVRFFLCGEYGGKLGRPHYHLLLFGHEFLEDRRPWRDTRYGKTYRSESLESVWGLGHVELGSVTFRSAGYVARYSLKKMTGDLAEVHYQGRQPEFLLMSRRPGIGRKWFEEFSDDLRDDAAVVLTGDSAKKVAVPRYYDKLFDAQELERRKAERKIKALKHRADNTPARLAVREEVKQAAIKSLKRTLE